MMMPAWVKGTLLLAVTFAAGIAVGVAVERRRAPRHEPASMQQHMVGRLTKELQLDSAQQEAVAAILARRQGAVDSSWHALQPHVRATLDSTMRDIFAVLRPDQADKYRKMVQTRHPGALH